MKTAITVLQELMVKLGQNPEFECVSQTGPKHQATFEYQCLACGVVVSATAHSKKEAKQNVAHLMLYNLSLKGHNVAPPYNLPPNFSNQSSEVRGSAGAGPGEPASEPVPARSYVALLKELCETFLLPAVDYELIGDTGPPHLRHFTIRARMGLHERCATATSKKAARQVAAEQLYNYLRENMPRITADFDEKEALVRAHDKARERYVETRDDTIRKPDLSLKISDYHLGLFAQIDVEKRTAVEQALEADAADEQDAEHALAELCRTLGLDAQFGELECESGALCVLHVSRTSPALAFAGAHRREASIHALRYFRTALRSAPSALATLTAPAPSALTAPAHSALTAPAHSALAPKLSG